MMTRRAHRRIRAIEMPERCHDPCPMIHCRGVYQVGRDLAMYTTSVRLNNKSDVIGRASVHVCAGPVGHVTRRLVPRASVTARRAAIMM